MWTHAVSKNLHEKISRTRVDMLVLLEARTGLLASLLVWPGWTRCGQSSVFGEAFHIVKDTKDLQSNAF